MPDSSPITPGTSKSNDINEKCRRGKRASRKKHVDNVFKNDALELISTRENVCVIPKKAKISKPSKAAAASSKNYKDALEPVIIAMENVSVIPKKTKSCKSAKAPAASSAAGMDGPEFLMNVTKNLKVSSKKTIYFKPLKASTESSTNGNNTLEHLINATEDFNVISRKAKSFKSSKSTAITSTNDIKPSNHIVSGAVSPKVHAVKVKKSKKAEKQLEQKIPNVVSTDCTDHIPLQQLQEHVIAVNKYKQKGAMATRKHTREKINKFFSEDIKSNNQKKQEISDKEKNSSEEVENVKTTSCSKMIKKTETNEHQAKSSKKVRKSFVDYISLEEAHNILQKQHDGEGEYIEGNIRINRRFSNHAYLAITDGEQDLLIIGLQDRNRALDGDLVIAKVNPEEEWYASEGDKKQKTGVVVYILEKVHPRKAIGFLKPTSNKDKSALVFQSRDVRFPLLIIDSKTLPPNFKKHPDEFAEVLFLAELTNWKSLPFAKGKILTMVGNVGDLEVETNAILLQNDLDPSPYDESLTKGLPSGDYVPTSADIENREDWRDKCIFSIDPATAVDLDDALSCTRLSNGNFEIGIHISDVTHFLTAFSFSPLDEAVAKRATTIYLANTTYHMLPKNLCQACSLLPGVDRLAFSVILEMTPEAEVIKHRFAKVVMNSCCQMSYEQAQAFIENPLKDWSTDESLLISGKWKSSEICDTVINLYKLSLILRKKRFDNGALRIDQPKIRINIDRTTGLPISYGLEKLQDSNRLIEEFMLLANMTVATHLYKTIPEYALLRKHTPPLGLVLRRIQESLQKFGIHLDIESAGSLQASLSRYECKPVSQSKEDQCVSQYQSMVLNALCARAMTPAKYKCSSMLSNEETLCHYALNIPLYTHFTSPIRRYADCIVHRLLYSTISNVPLPEAWSAKLCSKIAANCNKQKTNAKNAQDQSNELYFIFLLDLMGPVNTIAIVMDVKDRCVDVLLCQMGMKLRIYFADIKEEVNVKYSEEYFVPTITLEWKNHSIDQVINMFSIIPVQIEKHPSAYRLFGIPLPPVQIESST
ncbi:DIS3-like exonuclease 2 [Cephus cinctus]|uniref:DIS3-like exonuclease 2 n=1 Tax=Cephus cinctus TaxID=211228 RepID=A0AAJ7BVU1_CEPCN|nr:DIS3-like exonuclease 2 [Cephus cinctus]XP_015595523.1 DIS3-like exonuclease 2 [Cephus cinctus]XP_024940879.1 DIS3-like exonuclease 2 [Cephus cinctus]